MAGELIYRCHQESRPVYQSLYLDAIWSSEMRCWLPSPRRGRVNGVVRSGSGLGSCSPRDSGVRVRFQIAMRRSWRTVIVCGVKARLSAFTHIPGIALPFCSSSSPIVATCRAHRNQAIAMQFGQSAYLHNEMHLAGSASHSHLVYGRRRRKSRLLSSSLEAWYLLRTCRSLLLPPQQHY